RQLRHAVAVAYPDLLAVARLPDAVEQRRLRLDLDLGAAELAVMAALDLAAELVRHRLLAVADAEHRHLGGEDGGVGGRRLALDHRGRAPGEADAARIEALDPG